MFSLSEAVRQKIVDYRDQAIQWRTQEGYAKVWEGLLSEKLVSDGDEDRLGLLAAMFAPAKVSWPARQVPAAVMDALAEARNHIAEARPKEGSLKVAWETVVAFGCMFGRHLVRDCGSLDATWLDAWPQARAAVASQLPGSIRSVLRALDGWSIHGLHVWNQVAQMGRNNDPNNTVLHQADKLAMALSDPEEVLSVPSGATIQVGMDEKGPRVAGQPGGWYRRPLGYAPVSIRVDGHRASLCQLPKQRREKRIFAQHRFVVNLTAEEQIRVTINERASYWADPASGQSFEIRGVQSLSTFRCLCGGRHCAKRHRLAAWHPVTSLRLFLWKAITGGRGKEVKKLGSLKEGMYFSLLVDCGEVLRPVTNVAVPDTDLAGKPVAGAPPVVKKNRVVALADGGWRYQWYGICQANYLLDLFHLQDELRRMVAELAAPVKRNPCVDIVIKSLENSPHFCPAAGVEPTKGKRMRSKAINSLKAALRVLLKNAGQLGPDSREECQYLITALRNLRGYLGKRSDLCVHPNCPRKEEECRLRQNPVPAWSYQFAQTLDGGLDGGPQNGRAKARKRH